MPKQLSILLPLFALGCVDLPPENLLNDAAPADASMDAQVRDAGIRDAASDSTRPMDAALDTLVSDADADMPDPPWISPDAPLFAEPCPENFAKVAGYERLAPSFCIAMFEANVNSAQVAQFGVALMPTANRSRASASDACRARGPGYELITNGQWTSAARRIESVASNWSGGAVGVGHLAAGNVESYEVCTPSAGAYGGASRGVDCSTTGSHYFRRTLELPSGELVWDLSGNLREMVRDEPIASGIGLYLYFDDDITNEAYPEVYTTLDGIGTIRELFGPSGTYTNFDDRRYGIGMYVGNPSYSSASILRGGSSNSGSPQAGIFFAIDSYPVPESTAGFRCVWTPAASDAAVDASVDGGAGA